MKTISTSDFINQMMLPFSKYDCERSLPSAADGLKPSQRKIIYTVLEDVKIGADVKVANLGSAASNKTLYRHGETSIIEAVVRLAQDFPGSNNYPLLKKDGQFGNMIDNGFANPRYIHVIHGSNLTNIFEEDDKHIIEYLESDGHKIEPAFFLPKLPLILINGANGIGSGYASKITTRSVDGIKKAIKCILNGTDIPPEYLLPHYNGFMGKVEHVDDKQYRVTGTYKILSSTQIEITALPPFPGYQYEAYKNRVLLKKLLEKKKITSFDNESVEEQWKIIITCPRAFLKQSEEDLISELALSTTITENLNVWGFDNKLKSFDTAEDLLRYWVENRLIYIQKRKDYQLSVIAERISWLKSYSALLGYWLNSNNFNELIKLKRNEIIDRLKTVVDNNDHIKQFISQNILSLNEETKNKVDISIQVNTDAYDTLSKTPIEEIMIADIDSV